MTTSLMQMLHNTLGAQEAPPFMDHEGKPVTWKKLRRMYLLYHLKHTGGDLRKVARIAGKDLRGMRYLIRAAGLRDELTRIRRSALEANRGGTE